MPEKRMKYDREFREGAIRIVEETGKPIAQVARDLGINEGTLGKWVAQARAKRDGDGELSGDDVPEPPASKCLEPCNLSAQRAIGQGGPTLVGGDTVGEAVAGVAVSLLLPLLMRTAPAITAPAMRMAAPMMAAGSQRRD